MSARVTSEWYGQQAGAALARVQARVIASTAADMEAEAKREAMRLIYRTPESENYQRTGNLLNNIGHDLGVGSAEVFAAAEYSVYVHEGTRYMAPRPFLANALTTVGRTMQARVARITGQELNR